MELPRFSHAAKCLADAATILSTAAQAMAVAAQAFSAASAELEILRRPDACPDGTLAGKDSSLEASTEQQPTVDPTDCDNINANEVDHAMPVANPLEDHVEGHHSSPDSDYYMSDDDEEYINSLLRRQREEASNLDAALGTTATSLPTLPSARSTTLSPPLPVASLPFTAPPQRFPSPAIPPSKEVPLRFQRHILVNLETDVIPVVCALAQSHNKVVCYMHCPSPSIMVYQKIIKSATDSMVYAITRSTVGKTDMACTVFDRQDKAILLLPETVCSDVTLEAKSDLCVIHVGWPSSAEQYHAQVQLLDAPYSVLVACTEDQAMYPSCQEILDLTAPWPDKDKNIFGNTVLDICPKIHSALLEIPRDHKEQFYLDWIEAHGPHGKRRVSSWTPIILVYRANLYLLDVLQYHAQDPDLIRSQCPFPPVTQAFVTRNGLQPAVEKGILNLVAPSAPSNHSSSRPGSTKPAALPPNVQRPRSETDPSPGVQPMLVPMATGVSSPDAPITSNADNSVKPTPGPSGNRPEGSSQTAIGSEVNNEAKPAEASHMHTSDSTPSDAAQGATNQKAPVSGKEGPNLAPSNECLIIPDEFSLIPAICLLAKDKVYKNIVCYLQVVGIMKTLSVQIQAMISKPVFIVATPNSAAIPGALKAFDSPNGGLVFCNALTPLCEQLRSKTIHRVIHAGWVGNRDLYTKQLSTSPPVKRHIIMTEKDYSSIPDSAQALQALYSGQARIITPEASMYTLDPIRDQWQNQLNKSTEKSLNGCFMEWMLHHGTGSYKVKTWSTLELAARANEFAEQVLRRKSGKDGLKITQGFAKYLKLQEAVQAGVLFMQP